MTRLVFLDPQSPERLERLRPFVPREWSLGTALSRQPEDQLAALAGASFAITGDVPVTSAMIASKGLKAVHKWGVGYDNIDLEAARLHGVRVLRTTGSNAVSVAETTLGLILAVSRNLVRGHMGIQEGLWRKSELAPSSLTLSGRTIGIVGFGSIGQALAQLLQGFGCEILYTKRRPLEASEEDRLGARYRSLDELLGQSDVVTLNCELNDTTRNMMDAERISRMKPGAILVNAARGGIVVEADLAAALRSGALRGAASDVFSLEPIQPDNPLLSLDTMVLTPHLAAISADSFAPNLQRMMDNLRAIEQGEAPRDGDLLA